MMLLTKELRARLPKLYSIEGKKPEEVPIIVKFFCPWNDWAWYAVEFDGKDLFFGFVWGQFPEAGYFSLSEMQSVTGPMGLRIERDLYFGKHTLAEVMEKRL